MAKRQFTILAAMLLFAVTAHADILPYWGDRSCPQVEDVDCADPFPNIVATFYNPETGASTREELRFNGYWARFSPLDTDDYRRDIGCLTCDVYEGVLMLTNFDSHPADVYGPFGFMSDVDTGYSAIVFDGSGIRLVWGPVWRGWTDTGLWTRLYMAADGTWNFQTFFDDYTSTVTTGTWSVPRSEPTARLITDEPGTLRLLLPGLLLLVYFARKRPAGPPAG